MTNVKKSKIIQVGLTEDIESLKSLRTEPSLVYGGERWPTGGKEFRPIAAVEMKCYRRIVGNTRRDRAGNGKIRHELGQFHTQG